MICSTMADAQSRDTSLKYNFSQFWKETGHFFTTPLHWGGTDFLMIGSLAAGTAVAAVLENPARDVIFSNRALYQSFPAKVGNFYGGLYTPFILFAGYGGYSLVTGDIKARKIAYELGQACLYAGAITVALKTIIGRARPLANEGKGSFHFFKGFFPDDAFPSGHVTEAMTLSTVLAFNTDNLLWKIIAYLPVPFTLFSRGYEGWHWVSDCVFAAGIGFFTAKWCTDAHGRIDDAPQKNWKYRSEIVISAYNFNCFKLNHATY